MNLKTKITLGLLAMLALLLGLGAYAFGTVRRLDRDARAVLKDNFYSVQLGQQMLQALDAAEAGASDAPTRFGAALAREAGNVTERGEQQLVDSLLQQAAARPLNLAALRRQTHRMVQLNMAALARKNAAASRAAARAERLLLGLLSLGGLLALALVLSVPEAAVGGLRKLSASIASAAAGNFAASIPVESADEYGKVARAFNRLLVQLQDSRAANLAELTAERQRLTSIVQTLDEGLLLLDPRGTVAVANPVACRLLGVPEKALLGRAGAALAADNALFAQLLAYARRPAAERAAEPLVLAVGVGAEPDAHYQVAVHEATPFNSLADRMEFAGTIVALHNVSAYKQLDRTKSDFLATAAHELKTPLSSSNFNLKLLLDQRVGPLNAEQLDIVSSLKQENQRLQHVVSELLTVARLDAGAAVPLDPRPVAVPALVAAATEPLRLQLRPRGLALAVHLPPDLPAVRADLEKTAWVLLNLLANAVRFSPEGGQIRLSAAVAPDGRTVRLEVQDDGPGIAPELHRRIFERFALGPGAAGETRPVGTGLGLSISRDFIAQQGGEIGVASAPGAGSTFFFTLPTAA